MRKIYLLACSAFLALGAQAQVLTEGFEGGTFPPTGWTTFDNGVGTTESWGSSATFHNGAAAAHISYEAAGDVTEDWLVTGQIDLTTTNSELRFFARQAYDGDYATTYEIRISTASQNTPSDFVTVASWDETELNADYDTYEEKIVNLSAYDGDLVYIAFVMTQDNGDDWFIDDITVVDGPACPAPSLIQFANVNSDAADISWTAGSAETTWYVEYGAAGFTPGAGTLDTVTGTPAYAIGGLSASTAYDFYLQADCGGSQSIWAGPFSFTTTCVYPVIGMFPWTENFDAVTTPELPCGWNQEDVNNDDYIWTTDEYGYSGVNSLYIEYNSNEAMNDWVYTPELTLTAGTSYRLTFQERVYSADYPENLAVFIGATQNAAAMTQSLMTLEDIDNEEYVLRTVDFTVAATGSFHIGFHGYSEADQFALILDDVTLAFSPSCPEPSAIVADAIGSDEADLSWSAVSGQTSWNIEYGEEGFTPGAGTTDNVTGAPEYTVENLTPSTTYDFYVQSDCGNGDLSVWTGPFTFTTTCAAVAVTAYPWTESFDAVATPELPCGWAVENVNADELTWITDGYEANSAPNALYIEYNSTEAMNDWAYTPELVMEAGANYQLSFDYIGSGNTYPEKLKVFIGSAQASGTMTTEMIDLPNIVNDEFENQTVNFTVPANGSYYIGFHGYSDADMFFLALDDVTITECSPETASFTLAADTLCLDDASVTPVVTGTAGGFFYGTNGLDVDPATGEIDPAASMAGAHTLYYVTSSTACADTSMTAIVVEDCDLGIEEAVLAAVQLYPNPTNGVLNAIVPAAEGAVTVSVTDFTGKQVMTATSVSGQAIQLDLSALNNGVYFVQFELNTAKTTRRVVLTK